MTASEELMNKIKGIAYYMWAERSNWFMWKTEGERQLEGYDDDENISYQYKDKEDLQNRVFYATGRDTQSALTLGIIMVNLGEYIGDEELSEYAQYVKVPSNTSI